MMTNYSPGDLPAMIMFLLMVVSLYALGPLAMIWAVNTLFNTGIAYSFVNWAAVLTLWTLARTKITLN